MSELLKFITVVLVVIFVLPVLLFRLINVVETLGVHAEIEQVRADWQCADYDQRAFLIQRVVDMNRELARWQKQNKHWYFDWCISDSWDEVEPIDVEEEP